MNAPNCLTVLNHPDLLIPERFKINLGYRRSIPCHRLDAATGGILICAMTKEAEVAICQCFRKKFTEKKYLAIVQGDVRKYCATTNLVKRSFKDISTSGQSSDFLVQQSANPSKNRDCSIDKAAESISAVKNDSKDCSVEGEISIAIKGKNALTKYKVLSVTRSVLTGCDGWISTVELKPITGRRHQLRKHMQSIGHPIIGIDMNLFELSIVYIFLLKPFVFTFLYRRSEI